MKNTVTINFELPREEYPYFKMCCAKKGISLQKFVADLVVQAIEEYEDELLAQKALARISEMNAEDNISFEEACKLAGWDDSSV